MDNITLDVRPTIKMEINMSKKQERILSYKIATVLEKNEMENVSGGVCPVTTIGSQRFVSTQGGDSTIRFDDIDHI